MPIDPNIAMGVRPIEQPNMLAQMGQMMQLRQAQQGYESENALRDFYSQGGDTTTAEGRRKLMSTVGLKGADILKKEAETENTRATTSKTKADSIKVNVANSVAALAGVNDLPSYMAWHEANHDAKINPAMADYFKTMGIDPNQSKAHIAEVVAKLGPVAGLEQLKKESMGAVPELFKHITQSEDNRQTNIQSNTNNIRTTGATTRGQDLTNARAMEGTWSNITVGRRVLQQNSRTGEIREAQDPYDDKSGTVTVGPITNLPETPSGAGVVTGGGGGAPVSAKPNVLAATVGATPPVEPNVNALRNPPVVANAPAPKTRLPVTNPLMVEEKPVWNEKAGVYMLPPSAENPQGKVIEMPAVQEAVKKRAANETLKIAGFDPKTGSDEISELIKKSTSGLGENWASKAWGAITGTGTSGAEAIGKLETRAHEMTLGLAPNGSLGAGFSNEDREFMLRKLGDVANANAPMNIRLAAWEDVMERAARTTGTPYRKSFSSSAAVAPSTALPKGFKLD